MSIADAMYTYRMYYGISQGAMAVRLCRCRSLVSVLESGDRPASLKTIKFFCAANAIPVNDFLALSEAMDGATRTLSDQLRPVLECWLARQKEAA